MNVKIGELVEYVAGMQASHTRVIKKQRETIQILADIKRENEEELDGRAHVIANLEEQVKVAEERVEACKKACKEMEDLWGRRDQNILYWFKVNNLGEDRARMLLRYLTDSK